MESAVHKKVLPLYRLLQVSQSDESRLIERQQLKWRVCYLVTKRTYFREE